MSRFAWCVVGAGPAGIAALGKLLDAGVSPKQIAWVDPSFNVGDIGSKWYRVNGNTAVHCFKSFLAHCKSFAIERAPDFKLNALDEQHSCQLAYMVEPLKWITEHLLNRVTSFKEKVCTLTSSNHHWYVELQRQTIIADQVILATGAAPKTLATDKSVIPLEVALNDHKLTQLDLSQQTIGVYGSSHSAIVAMKNLLNTKAKKIINFYRQPIKYAVYLDDFILFDNCGLKDYAADWARKHIDGKLPERLERVHCSSEQKDSKLAECNSLVFCIGFERKNSIHIPPYKHNLSYNESNGIIAPGLFGVGIAYPYRITDPLGNVEHDVGMNKFMRYLDKVIPIWLQYKA